MTEWEKELASIISNLKRHKVMEYKPGAVAGSADVRITRQLRRDGSLLFTVHPLYWIED
jgi:hypothetical protein